VGEPEIKLRGPVRLREAARLRGFGQILGGIASVAVLLTLVIVVALVSQRGRGDGGDGSPGLAGAGAAAPTPVPPVVSDVASGRPTAAADELATPVAVGEPPPTSTPRPTRTPKPVVGTEPEGTPHYHRASGHLGETIANDELSVRVDPAQIPATYDVTLCARIYPAYSEPLAYKITETWTRWTKVDWTFELNNESLGSWAEFAPDFGNGKSNVIVICHQPGTPTTITIYSGPLEHTDVPEDYQWTIR
jgi:hypothetical protein